MYLKSAFSHSFVVVLSAPRAAVDAPAGCAAHELLGVLLRLSCFHSWPSVSPFFLHIFDKEKQKQLCA